MAKAGLRSANRSRTLLGTLTLSGTPHMPITTSHMPSDMVDQAPGNSISKRETFFGIRARVGWAWHHVSGHPSSWPYTAAACCFFFNYFLVFPRCSMLRGCLRTDCSLLAARGREEEEAAMPTRSPTSPPGGAQGAHDLPQPPNVLDSTLESSWHVSLLNISFFNYIPIGLCYIRILWS